MNLSKKEESFYKIFVEKSLIYLIYIPLKNSEFLRKIQILYLKK